MKKILLLVLVVLISVSAAFASDWTVSAGVGYGKKASVGGLVFGVDAEYLYQDNISFFGTIDNVIGAGFKLRAGAEYLVYAKNPVSVNTGVGILVSEGFGAAIRACAKYQINDQWSAFVSGTTDFTFIKAKSFTYTAKLGVSYAL